MGFNRLLALGCLISGLVFGACGSAKKTTASNKGKNGKQLACSVNEDQPHLSWYVEKTELLDSFRMKQPIAPGARVYTLDTNSAKSFFALFKDSVGRKTKVVMPLPLPAPNECKTFDVSVSRVMNDKLREKYPDIIALEGKATDGKGDARINWDGHKVKIQVNMGGQVTLVNAIRYHGQTYYMVYSRASSPDKKEPFEETGVPHDGNKK
jgi:hypothetical protein